MDASKRVDLVENEDFALQVEYNQEIFIVHLARLKPRKASIQAMKERLDELDAMVEASSWKNMFTAVEPENRSINKLMRTIGANYLGTEDGLNVYVYGELR